MQAEVDVDDHLYGHRLALINRRPEPVLLDGGDGFVIEAHTKMTNHAHVLRVAICVDNKLNRNRSLVICLARLRRELRFNRMDHLGSAHSPPDTHNPAAKPGPAAGALPNAVSGAQSSAQAHAEPVLVAGLLSMPSQPAVHWACRDLASHSSAAC